ncbi:MAG: carbohydrate ABC transporter permease [Caldilineaceae bacterium]
MSQQSLSQASSHGVAIEQRRPALRFSLGPLFVYLLLILLAVAMLFPYYYLVINAFKGTRGFAADPYSLIPKTFSLESIIYAWDVGRINVYLRNSAFYATIVVVIQTLINAMAAYAFARVQFPGRNVLFLGVLATMMLPYSVLLIPTYLIVWSLGLANTVYGVVIPGFASAYGIFMLRQFFSIFPLNWKTRRALTAVVAPVSSSRLFCPWPSRPWLRLPSLPLLVSGLAFFGRWWCFPITSSTRLLWALPSSAANTRSTMTGSSPLHCWRPFRS